MKSTIRIPLAITLGALCLGAANAATAQEMTNNIYGNFRFSLSYVDEQGDDNLQGDNNASRFGLKGEVKGDRLTGFYHLEAGARNDGQGSDAFTSRFYYAGVKGGFGALTVGRHSTAYKMAGLNLDPFYDLPHVGPGGVFAASGATYGTSSMTNSWANNTVAYTSPKFVGLTVNAASYIDDGSENNHDYAAGLAYAIGDFTVGLQYYDAGDHAGADSIAPWVTVPDNEPKAYRGHGSWASGPFKAGISYEKVDPDATGAEDQDYIYVSGSLAVLTTTRIAVSVGDVSDDTANSPLEGTGFNVGVFHDLFKDTTAYLLYSTADLDNVEDTDVVSLGFIYNFNTSL
jgi:predicted porin